MTRATRAGHRSVRGAAAVAHRRAGRRLHAHGSLRHPGEPCGPGGFHRAPHHCQQQSGHARAHDDAACVRDRRHRHTSTSVDGVCWRVDPARWSRTMRRWPASERQRRPRHGRAALGRCSSDCAGTSSPADSSAGTGTLSRGRLSREMTEPGGNDHVRPRRDDQVRHHGHPAHDTASGCCRSERAPHHVAAGGRSRRPARRSRR